MAGLRENHVCAGIFGDGRVNLLHVPEGGSTWGSGETYACCVEVGGPCRLYRIDREPIVGGDLNPVAAPVDVDHTATAAGGKTHHQNSGAWQVQLISSMRYGCAEGIVSWDAVIAEYGGVSRCHYGKISLGLSI